MKRLCSLGLGLFALCALMAAGCLEEFPEWPARSGGGEAEGEPDQCSLADPGCERLWIAGPLVTAGDGQGERYQVSGRVAPAPAGGGAGERYQVEGGLYVAGP